MDATEFSSSTLVSYLRQLMPLIPATGLAHNFSSTMRDPLITTALVVAESGYLIDRQLGPGAEALFYRSDAEGDLRVEPPGSDDWERIAVLIDQYDDLPLGGTDASLIVLVERLGVHRLVKLDHRHFSVVQPRGVDTLI